MGSLRVRWSGPWKATGFSAMDTCPGLITTARSTPFDNMPRYSPFRGETFEHLLGSFGAPLALGQLFQSRPCFSKLMMRLEALWMRFDDKMGRLLQHVTYTDAKWCKSFHAGPWQGGGCKVQIKPGTIVNWRCASLQSESCFHTTQLEHYKIYYKIKQVCLFAPKPFCYVWMKHSSGLGLGKLERCLSLSCGTRWIKTAWVPTKVAFLQYPPILHVWQCLTLAEPTLRYLLPQPLVGADGFVFKIVTWFAIL